MRSFKTVNRLATMMAIAVRQSSGVVIRHAVVAPYEWGWPDAEADREGLGDKEPPRPPAQRARY